MEWSDEVGQERSDEFMRADSRRHSSVASKLCAAALRRAAPSGQCQCQTRLLFLLLLLLLLLPLVLVLPISGPNTLRVPPELQSLRWDFPFSE